MKVKARKIGNSLAVSIPSVIAKIFPIGEGDTVDISLNDDHIEITPEYHFTGLDDLFKNYDGKDKMEDIDWGNPIGKEIW
ncbi:MAG: AbrB/MazE/SpoVT family DNA-binding domain-containing protein [Bilifractor sp.]